MFIVRPPKIVRKIFHNLIWKIPNTNNTIYLTFDDGPNPETTPFILDILDQYQAKATFFCVGDNVRKYPEMYKEILKRGHITGNHTYNHLNGWKTNYKAYYINVLRAQSHISSKLFRPPYGKMTIRQKQLILRSHSIIMWDILSRDYDKTISKEECLHNVIDNVQSGSIVVFHDSIKAAEKVEYVLPETLKVLSNCGYNFKTITIL